MGYYRGDYYRGDYYRGDPFLGALLGKVASKVAPKIGRWIGQRISGSGGKIAARAKAVGLDPEMLMIGGATAAAGALGHHLAQRAQNSTVLGPMPTMGPMEQGGAMAQGGGNVAIFVSRDGRRIRKRWSVSQQRWIAIRKLNPLNPRALKRGLKRAQGFDKFARKTMNALYRTVPGKVKQRRFKKA